MNERLIGKNIARHRKQRNLTLEQLARLSGLTKSYLSRIERSTKAPPYSTMSRIASALGVGVSSLLDAKGATLEDARICFTRRGKGELVETVGASSGYRFMSLSHEKPGKNMLPYIIEAAFDESAVFQHEGEEFLYVLEGTHEFTYDGETYVMEEGDSVYFDAGVPHTGRSIGPTKARLLAIVYNYRRT